MLLLDPLLLRGRTAPSRVLFGPHETNLARRRAIADRHVPYYARRAAGGAGVIVTETASVHELDWPYERSPLAADCGPGWRAVVQACQDTLVLASLGHAGGQGSSAYSQRELWAPSPVPDVGSREVPKEMELADIEAVIAGFGVAAALAMSSGLAGVEVDAGPYSLVRQFLSGLTNQRGDRYGTDRLALAREVLAVVRAAVGTGVLGLRLSCDELAPWAGITPEQSVGIAAELAADLDYLVVVRGSAMAPAVSRPDGHTEQGFGIGLARDVRAVLPGSVAVVAQGSIVDPAVAEQALASGAADAVEMTRALLADAALVAALRRGEPERVRPCVLCNQACQVRDPRNPIVSCVADPWTGHEWEEPEPELRRGPRRAIMTGGGRYKYLFSPLRIGPVTLPNRIVFAAHLTNYADDGLATEQHAAYYEARARGGTGLIITEEHSTHPSDWPYEKLIHGFHAAVVPGYRRITEAVHRHGTPIFAQINHNGGQASSMFSRLPVWSASPVADPLFREVAKGIDDTEIAEVVAGYALVAEHCRQGGFDGIELQCSHSSIVRAFLSPATNKRTDRYGGSQQNRARLLHEIVDSVREAIGRDMALGVRLCGDELIDGGSTLADAVEVAKSIEAAGRVDYINTSIGVATASLYMIEASMAVPPGYALFIPSALRKAVSLPVVGVGRFKDPVQAERALADGHCDLIGVVRGQIADADFAAKARAGRTDDIRLCLSCNQECVGRMGLNRWLGCIENPCTGREALALPAVRAAGRKVVVVGGGPAGLQAALTAAQRGHDVELHEAAAAPGGQVALAAKVPNRAEFGDLIRNQLSECSRYGVRLVVNSAVTSSQVTALKPDVVVLATGSRPAAPWWADGDAPDGAPRVVDLREVLTGEVTPSGRVVVIDELGFHQATSVAELLADRGCTVEVLTPGMVVGQDLSVTLDMEHWSVRAHAKGIVQTTDCVVTGRQAGGLSVLHHTTGQTRQVPADWVVLAVPGRADDELYRELLDAGGGFEVHRVGDCVAPRRAHAAVVDGHRVGSAL